MIAAHRAPEHAQLVPHLLGAVTEMPVVEVKEGMRLAPNRVFVIPPRTDMTKTGNEFRLRTTARPPGWPKTINLSLFSLERAIGPRAVAVVLSGLDGDRCAASKSIKATGGMTFAQSDPTIESMPREAVETGHIDPTLPAAEIAKALPALAREPLPTVRSGENGK